MIEFLSSRLDPLNNVILLFNIGSVIARNLLEKLTPVGNNTRFDAN